MGEGRSGRDVSGEVGGMSRVIGGKDDCFRLEDGDGNSSEETSQYGSCASMIELSALSLLIAESRASRWERSASLGSAACAVELTALD